MSIRRVLVVDDSENIHKDFETIFSTKRDSGVMDELEKLLFNDKSTENDQYAHHHLHFELDHAMSGHEGIEKVKQAQEMKRPYAMTFLDMRMPQGFDGLQTAEQLLRLDRHLEIVFCTAYSDYDLKQILSQLKRSHRFLILKKPFDPEEVLQMAYSLTSKWLMSQDFLTERAVLDDIITERVKELTEANKVLGHENQILKELIRKNGLSYP